MIAYIAELKKQAEKDDCSAAPQSGLHQRFVDWYSSLPTVSRNRPFAMSEFETALNTQGRYLSPVLLCLGWKRKRIWNTNGHYHRYWVPPEE